MDSFLEREKELMKLNETLNNKISFDLKPPNMVKTATKSKKPQFNKSMKNEISQTKTNNSMNTLTSERESLNSKIDICSDSKNSISTNAHSIEKFTKKCELEWKDNAYNNNPNNRLDDANKIEQIKKEKSLVANKLNELSMANTDKIIIDDKIQRSASALSLIPQNVIRRNVSTEGIIK